LAAGGEGIRRVDDTIGGNDPREMHLGAAVPGPSKGVAR